MTNKELLLLKILRFGALYVLITGLLPVLAVFEATQEPWRLFFDVLNWPLDGHPSDLSITERQLSGVLGGVLCGWAWLIYKLADPSVFSPKIRIYLMQSVWVWFFIDSIASIIVKIPMNAVSNLSFLLILIVPLHALKPRS